MKMFPVLLEHTHWARNGFKYFQSQGLDLPELAGAFDGLTIKINKPKSKYTFIPTPRIKLEEVDDKNENTVYHEFGHHTMYCIQGGKFKIPCNEGDSHSYSEENTSRLAWTEG